MAMFGPISSSREYFDELRACYANAKDTPLSLSLKHPRLFRNETESLRKVRIYACMIGFERTHKLFTGKVNLPKKDPDDIYACFGISQGNDNDGSITPDYDNTSLVDDGLPNDLMYRPDDKNHS